jgi:hypothetical protein
MDRNDSSRLGEQQAEGNLGNERNRNTGRARDRERMRSRSKEGGMGERSRESEDRERGEEWSPASDVHDNNDARRGGSDR